MDKVSDLGDALPTALQPSVHVEVCQNTCSTVRPAVIKSHVVKLLHRQRIGYGNFTLTDFDDPFLTEHVTSISVCDTDLIKSDTTALDFCSLNLRVHVCQLNEEGPASEELDDEDLSAAMHWLLPCREFHGLWDSLVFDSEVKNELLQYVSTTMLFSDRKVDSNIISWNRVVLLHGPPGTGKTSLCKALAQKLCIRLSDRYSYGQLIEINSHSLFSKWFSESGKLVMKMFTKIQELIDDPDALVIVLIDEVESLAAARKSASSGVEPSDAIRVVNALLTQLDQIKRNSNVIILTTSNITGAIDLAFVDRADIKQYIGNPSPPAIFKIYQSCLQELMRAGIISPPQQLLDLRALEVMRYVENDATRLSLKLRDISICSEGLSGRTLRKLPFIAQALYIQKPTVSMEVFLDALKQTALRQFREKDEMGKDK